MLNESWNLRRRIIRLLSRRQAGHCGVLYYIEPTPYVSLGPGVSQGTPTNFFHRETELLAAMLPRIRNGRASGGDLVDLGPGSPSSVEQRSMPLARALAVHAYVPVDVSTTYLAAAEAVCRREMPDIAVHSLNVDFFDPNFALSKPASFLYMGGSTISNLPVPAGRFFLRPEYQRFINKLASLLAPDGRLLIGWHAPSTENSALAPYCGAEARYFLETPLRVLTHLGAEGLTDEEWQSTSIWDESVFCVRHNLEAKKDVTVTFANERYKFEKGFRLEVAPSYNIPELLMSNLAQGAGLRVVQALEGSGDYRLWLFDKEI